MSTMSMMTAAAICAGALWLAWWDNRRQTRRQARERAEGAGLPAVVAPAHIEEAGAQSCPACGDGVKGENCGNCGWSPEPPVVMEAECCQMCLQVRGTRVVGLPVVGGSGMVYRLCAHHAGKLGPGLRASYETDVAALFTPARRSLAVLGFPPAPSKGQCRACGAKFTPTDGTWTSVGGGWEHHCPVSAAAAATAAGKTLGLLLAALGILGGVAGVVVAAVVVVGGGR